MTTRSSPRGDRVLEHVQAEHRDHDRGGPAGGHPASDSPPCRTNSAVSAWTSSPRRCAARRSRATARELDPEHTAAAIALLFENFTTVFVGTSGLGIADQRRGRHRHAVDDLEENAVRVLSHERRSLWISRLPDHLPGLLAEMDAFIEAEIKPLEREHIQYFDHRREYARTDWDNGGIPRAGVGGPARRDAQRAPTRRAGCATACRRSSAAATAPMSTWRSSGNTWRTRDSGCTTTCRTSPRSSATSRR